MWLFRVNQVEAQEFNRDSLQAITVAVILGTVGAATILVMPGFLGVIVDVLGLTEKQLGFVAFVDVLTMGIAMGVTAYWICKFSWRLLALVGLAVMALGNLASLLATDYSTILWARGLAGIGEGIAVAVAFAALGVTRNPDRSFGLYLVFALLFSSIVLYAFPFLVMLGGNDLVFGLLISLSFISILFLPWLTPQAKVFASNDGETQNTPVSLLIVGIGFLMVTLFFVAQGAVWSYLDRIGFAKGIDPISVGSALALSALAGIAGAGVSMLLGNKRGRLLPISVGIVVQLISLILLLGTNNTISFTIAVMLFNFSWNLCQPYFSGIMCEIDPQGRVVVLMGSIQTIGVCIGPFIAALIIKPEQLDPISYLGILCISLSLLAAYVVIKLWKNFGLQKMQSNNIGLEG